MPNASLSVATADKLLGALANSRCDEIIVEGVIKALPTLKLRPGVAIRGGSEDATLVFAADVDGLQLTRDNTVEDLCISASVEQRALFNDTRQSGFGILHLARLTVYGQVQLIAADKLQTGHVEIDGLDIVAADARGSSLLSLSSNAARGKAGAKVSVKAKAPEKLDVYGVGISEGQQRPHGFGVHVIQGAFTLWNMQPDPSSLITADLRGISVGRASAPVLGSGVFVSGSVVKGVNGGKLSVALLETGAIYSNGMIAPGLPCGRAGRNHDNITLYSCDRPSPYCSRARICPGTGVNRLTFAPGQKSLSRYAISGHFREPGQDNPQSPHTPTNRIGGIQPIPKSTYCPGSHVERLTCKPGQRELSRYAKNTRFRKPGQ